MFGGVFPLSGFLKRPGGRSLQRYRCAGAQVSPTTLGPVGHGSERLRPTASLPRPRGARRQRRSEQCIWAHTPAPSQTRPRRRRHAQAYAGTCMHTGAQSLAQHPRRAHAPARLARRACPPAAPSRADQSGGARRSRWGSCPSQGGLGKPWRRLPPHASFSLPFKKTRPRRRRM